MMYCHEPDNECNTKKTFCTIFKPRSKTRYITDDFPNYTPDGCAINFVSEFLYLGQCSNYRGEGDPPTAVVDPHVIHGVEVTAPRCRPPLFFLSSTTVLGHMVHDNLDDDDGDNIQRNRVSVCKHKCVNEQIPLLL